MNKQIKRITYTALLLGLALVFQSLRVIIPQVVIPGLGQVDQYIIGSLVNTVLIISTLTIGITSGITIGVATPLIAFLQGEIAFPILVPFVALGNIAIVVIVGLFFKKNEIAALALGAIGKFLTLFISINYIVLPMLVPTLPTDKGVTVSKLLSFKFGYPQLITAVIGGIIAYVLYPRIKGKLVQK